MAPNRDLERRELARRSTLNLNRETTNAYRGDLDIDSDLESEESEAPSSPNQQVQGLTSSLSRSQSRLSRRQRTESVLSRIRSRPPIGAFTHPLQHQKTTTDDLVDFEGPDDPYHPVNWAMKKKIYTTALYGLTTMTASWASATISSGTTQIAREFHVGTQTATLSTTLFLFGFGLGPLIWAPLSEVYGRKLAVLPPVFIAVCFTFATATADNIQTIMITRFFAALFCSAPVTNTGGVLADLFPASQRAIAVASYSMAVIFGPVFGPIVGAAFVSNPSLGWRWTEYFSAIIMVAVLVLDVIFCDESYPPKLLVYKAQKLRIESGNWALHAKFEEWDVSLTELAHKFLFRPVQILFTPIAFCLCLYASFCYGILYMNLGAIPIIFQELRHWHPFVASLPFIGLLIGGVIGAAINVVNQIVNNRRPPESITPELRLYPMMGGSIAFSGGLFIVGWTGPPENGPWIAPIIGIALVGVGFLTIFQSALNYLIDTFSKYSASAVAANTFLRSCFAGAFPLVVTPLYHNVGVPWGTSIFAFFSMALIPVPFLLFRYGESLRKRSKWSRDSVKPRKLNPTNGAEKQKENV